MSKAGMFTVEVKLYPVCVYVLEWNVELFGYGGY